MQSVHVHSLIVIAVNYLLKCWALWFKIGEVDCRPQCLAINYLYRRRKTWICFTFFVSKIIMTTEKKMLRISKKCFYFVDFSIGRQICAVRFSAWTIKSTSFSFLQSMPQMFMFLLFQNLCIFKKARLNDYNKHFSNESITKNSHYSSPRTTVVANVHFGHHEK